MSFTKVGEMKRVNSPNIYFADSQLYEREVSMEKKIILLPLTIAFCILTIFGFSNASAAPEASVVKEVVDYFYNGQEEGPILIESKLCKTIKSLNCEEVMEK